MDRKEYLLRQWEEKHPRLSGETDRDFAIRVFRENHASDYALELLSEVMGIGMSVLITIGQGTLWRLDEPSTPIPSFEECVESFLRALSRFHPLAPNP